jgi:hypothetical protein
MAYTKSTAINRHRDVISNRGLFIDAKTTSNKKQLDRRRSDD